jgi:hypothetical protein
MRPQATGWTSPFRCPTPVIVLFIFYCLFLVLAPWIPPIKKTDVSTVVEEETKDGSLPWYLTPVCGLAVLFAGTVYWFFWLHVVPAIHGQRLVEEEVMMDNGPSYTRYIGVNGRRRYFENEEKNEKDESTPPNTSQTNV